MLVLVLDSATPAITAALAEINDDVMIIAERVTVDGRAHGELLAPAIEAVLQGVKPRDLSAIVAGSGPGPFTGLRAGLVTAKTMSMVLGIPAYSVCTLDALGLAGSGAASGGPVLVATDARRREIYWGLYFDREPVTEPQVGRPADVAVTLAAQRVLHGVGEGAQRYADVLGIAAAEPLYPAAIDLARLAAGRVRRRAPGEALTPLYLRRPDAVEPAGRKPALAAGER